MIKYPPHQVIKYPLGYHQMSHLRHPNRLNKHSEYKQKNREQIVLRRYGQPLACKRSSPVRPNHSLTSFSSPNGVLVFLGSLYNPPTVFLLFTLVASSMTALKLLLL